MTRRPISILKFQICQNLHMIQNLLMKKGKNFDGMENFGAEWR